MKQYLGIIISALYALVIRILAEYNLLEINSWTYLIITPMIVGFIPFFFKQKTFLKSTFRTIAFPIISVLLFLIIAVISGFEDLACFLIIGFPYILFSILISLLLRSYFNKTDKDITINAFPILLLPILLGVIEKQFPKVKSEIFIANEIIINAQQKEVWDNLLSVPDLSNGNSTSISSYLGVPEPFYSTYDSIRNIRLGYFDNQIVLHEYVIKRIENKKIVFKIDVGKSNLENSPTLKHILYSPNYKGINKNLEFDNITYEVENLGKNRTKLKLSTKFTINSNLSKYGKFWSNIIINNFEKNLLSSLKRVIEKE